MCDTNTNFGDLLPPTFSEDVERWIKEDIPSFDIGAFVVGSEEKQALLYAKSNLMLAGEPFFSKIFEKYSCKVDWKVKEGTYLQASNKDRIIVAVVTGKAKDILQGERIALNVLTRCSSIATHAREAIALKEKYGYKGVIAGTRKTTPGFRIVEKYALLVAGAATHRYDLSSMVMLKDNHIDACGSITRAVEKAKMVTGFSTLIEVECRSLEDGMEAAAAGANIIMLDNFKPDECKRAAKILKEKFPYIVIEASGGLTINNMTDYFCDYIDVLSLGSLTQGVYSVDLSLKIKK